jgi:hypothetical protein
VYEIAQIIELATGRLPSAAQLDGWGAYENTGGSLQSISDAFVASTMFADKYNNGTPVDPNAPVTFNIAQEIIENALGVVPTTAHVDAWVDSGLAVGQVFQAFALGDQFAGLVESQMFIYEISNDYFIVPRDPLPAETTNIIGITDVTAALS